MKDVICKSCGNTMSESDPCLQLSGGIHFFECECGETAIFVDAPDELSEAADYYFERAGDR